VKVLTEAKYKGNAADVWSLGVMLYVMIEGAFPFRLRRQRYQMQKMIGRIVNAEYKRPTHVRRPRDVVFRKQTQIEQSAEQHHLSRSACGACQGNMWSTCRHSGKTAVLPPLAPWEAGLTFAWQRPTRG